MSNILKGFFYIPILDIKFSVNPFFWLIIISAIMTNQFLEIITLFGIVIIHELGHVFAAKSYKWKIIEIQLLPFGGMAKVEQNTDSIWEELIVALSGPLQNFTMIVITIGFETLHLWSNEWATFFIQANLLIGIFNLIPIHPLDGYKILRGFFYLILPYRRAIMISIFVSIVLNLLFLIWASGFFLDFKINLNGIILGIFFTYNNLMEIKNAPYYFWRFLFNKSKGKSRNISATPIIINNDTSIMQAFYLLYKDRYHIFYLLSESGEIIKTIPEERLIRRFIKKKDLKIPISNI